MKLGRTWHLQRIARVKPWLAIALVVAVVLVGYWASLGLRYWQGSGQVAALEGHVQELSAALRSGTSTERAVTEELRLAKVQLEGLRSQFTYQRADDLMAVVSAAARETRVGILSMSMGDSQVKARGDVHYRAQMMALTAQGDRTDMFRFLSTVAERVPVTSVESLRLSNLEGAPVAQVQLLFYLSPQPASTK